MSNSTRFIRKFRLFLEFSLSPQNMIFWNGHNLWSSLLFESKNFESKIYEIVAKSHDDVMTTGNHQNRIQWLRFSTWENFSCKNIHKLSIYEIFLKRHGDVIPTGNDQNRVQWTRLSIRFKFQQIWFKFWNNGGILKSHKLSLWPLVKNCRKVLFLTESENELPDHRSKSMGMSFLNAIVAEEDAQFELYGHYEIWWTYVGVWSTYYYTLTLVRKAVKNYIGQSKQGSGLFNLFN